MSTGPRSRAAVSVLPFYAYENVNWNFIAGLENHHTPISDFLVDLFRTEAATEIAMTTKQAEDYFDLIEINVALGFAHCRLEEMKLSEGLWFWMPVGRFMWRQRRTTLEARLREIEAMSPASPYFAAGMLGGSAKAAAETIAAIRDHLSKVSGRFW